MEIPFAHPRGLRALSFVRCFITSITSFLVHSGNSGDASFSVRASLFPINITCNSYCEVRAETEDPGVVAHPPALTYLHDHGLPHALVDAEMPVHSQHHQGYHGHGNDGGHQPLDCPAGKGPGHVVTAPGQHRVRQGQISYEQQRETPGGGLQK